MFKNLLLFVLYLSAGCAWADPVAAARLQAKHAALEAQLQQNQFNRPLVLTSVETSQRVSGEIYAVINHPFSAVSAGLNTPDRWCDLMSLPMNTKYCRAETASGGTVLKVNIGKKATQRLEDAPRIEFKYTLAQVTANYLDVQLNALTGPMGTSDYKISFEAIPLGSTEVGAKTFIHMSYSYSVNLVARLAMQTYLATLGRNKVGFTRVGQQSNGAPVYVDGVRGVVERNTMRYYLAIDSYLDAAPLPPQAALEKRLQTWFSASELYPQQLHELERSEYVAMKREEYARQQMSN